MNAFLILIVSNLIWTPLLSTLMIFILLKKVGTMWWRASTALAQESAVTLIKSPFPQFAQQSGGLLNKIGGKSKQTSLSGKKCLNFSYS